MKYFRNVQPKKDAQGELICAHCYWPAYDIDEDLVKSDNPNDPDYYHIECLDKLEEINREDYTPLNYGY